MSTDLTNSDSKLTCSKFKEIINRVETYKNQGGEDGKGNISHDRKVYLNYPSTDEYITYEKYCEMKNRYDTFKSTNNREPAYIKINNLSVSPVGKRFTKEVLNNLSKIIQTSIKNGEGVPNGLNATATDNNEYFLSKNHLAGLYESRNIFRLNNGRDPNYVTCNSSASNPFIGEYQPNSYTCGSTSLANAIRFCYGYVSEKECRITCQTSKNGTNPSNLISGAKKLGYTVTPMERTYENVKNALAKGYGVVGHIQTAGNTKPACLGFINNYGHYVAFYKAEDNKIYVFDPTKGWKTCSATSINNATNGRKIYYYSVKPL